MFRRGGRMAPFSRRASSSRGGKAALSALSIDGGGIRGVFPAAVLAELEEAAFWAVVDRQSLRHDRRHFDGRHRRARPCPWDDGARGLEYLSRAWRASSHRRRGSANCRG